MVLADNSGRINEVEEITVIWTFYKNGQRQPGKKELWILQTNKKRPKVMEKREICAGQYIPKWTEII